MFTQRGEVCNGCVFYDRENLSTHFKVICICNIVAGDFQQVCGFYGISKK